MSAQEAPRRMTAADREREAREAAVRRRRLSVRIGSGGIFLLFVGGLAIFFVPTDVAPFLGLMVVGVILIVIAMLLVTDLVRDLTKIT